MKIISIQCWVQYDMIQCINHFYFHLIKISSNSLKSLRADLLLCIVSPKTHHIFLSCVFWTTGLFCPFSSIKSALKTKLHIFNHE